MLNTFLLNHSIKEIATIRSYLVSMEVEFTDETPEDIEEKRVMI